MANSTALSIQSIAMSARQNVDLLLASAQQGDVESIGWLIVIVLSMIVALVYVVQALLSRSSSSSTSAKPTPSSSPDQLQAPLPPVYSVGMPVIGTLLAFAKDPLGTVWAAYRENGPVFTLRLLHKRLTFVIGPAASDTFFQASDTELDQNEPYRFSTPVFGKDVVYDATLTNRLQHFRILSMTLRVNVLESYVPLMVAEATAFFAKWGDSGTIDLFDSLSNLIILTGSRCIMGREVRETLFGEVSHLIHDLDQGMQPISVLANWLPTRAHRARDRARKQMGKLFEPVIKARREASAGAERPHDMLQWLIDARYKNGEKFKDHEIVGNLIAGLFAAQHTSSATSTWVGMYLLRNASALSTAQAEQAEVLGAADGKLDYSSLVRMDWLHSCMKEVLRLHPPLIFLMRSVLEQRRALGGRLTIPPRDFLVVSPHIAGRLPDVYKKPDSFDPARFLPPREEDKKAPFSFLGFGAGRHGCMGEGFAYLQVKTIWTILLNTFEMTAVGDDVPQPNYDALVVGPKHNTCFVKYKRKRNPKFKF